MLVAHRVPSWFTKLYPELVWFGEPDDRKVYLTFDDGPHPEITPWVMDQLALYQFKATFFCVGENCKKHPDVLQKLQNEGHAIGNHTFNHLKGWNTPTQEYIDNISLADQQFSSSLFRPPYGRITRTQIKSIKDSKKIVMWSLLAADYHPSLNVPRAFATLTKHTKPGSIVVFHDSVKAKNNLELLLPAYLEYLKEHDFQPALF